MRSETLSEYMQRILRVLLHIQNHLDEAMSLDDLAQIAHFSPFHFHRVFRGMVGESVMEHIRRLRLERAAYALKNGDEPIARVAFEAGYEAHEAFSRAFRSMFDLSPSRFREQYRAIPVRTVPSGVHYDPRHQLKDFLLPENGESQMEGRIENLPAMKVVFVRHIGPYERCHEAWAKLCSWAGPRGILGPKTLCIGQSYDDPEVTPPEKIRYDACLTVNGDFKGEGEIGVQTIGGGKYAVTTHHGPYTKLAETYAKLCGQWMPGNNLRFRSGPSLEIYRNNPEETAPEELITDVYVPVE